jgi:hypothetical protein
MDDMNNSYETAQIVEIGAARQMILGIKYIDWLDEDWCLGPGFGMWDIEDIDESDE